MCVSVDTLLGGRVDFVRPRVGSAANDCFAMSLIYAWTIGDSWTKYAKYNSGTILSCSLD